MNVLTYPLLLLLLVGTAWGQPALFEAARTGSPAEVSAALATGANVDARDEHGQTPLFYAAEHNSPAVAESLIRAGADVNARTPGGWTPLMVAFRNTAYPQMVPSLFNLGARPEAVLFETYANERLNYSLDYPVGILEPQGELSAGDGQSFLSRDGRARMLVFSSPRASGESLAERYARESAETDSRTVTYRLLRDDWFVVSGYEYDEVFYQKTLLAGDRFIITDIKYSRSLQTIFNPITSQISWSFGLGSAPPVQAEAPAAPAPAPQAPRPAPVPAPPQAAPTPPDAPAQAAAPTPPAPTPPALPAPEASRPQEAADANQPAPAPPERQEPTSPAATGPAPTGPAPSSPAPSSPGPDTPPAERAEGRAETSPAPSPVPSPTPSRETPASPRFFDEAFRLAGVREITCDETVLADAAPAGLEVRCGRKRQDAVSFKLAWDRAAAAAAAEAISAWQFVGGSHRRDFQQGTTRMTVLFNDGYIIDEAEIVFYRRPAR